MRNALSALGRAAAQSARGPVQFPQRAASVGAFLRCPSPTLGKPAGESAKLRAVEPLPQETNDPGAADRAPGPLSLGWCRSGFHGGDRSSVTFCTDDPRHFGFPGSSHLPRILAISPGPSPGSRCGTNGETNHPQRHRRSKVQICYLHAGTDQPASAY
jgi:hypothetical protein